MNIKNTALDGRNKAAFLAGYWAGTDINELELVKDINWIINNHGECIGAEIMVDPMLYVSLNANGGKLTYIDNNKEHHVMRFQNLPLYRETCEAGDNAMRDLFA